MSAAWCVIINPRAGRRRAGRQLVQQYRHWQEHADCWLTCRPGQAEELAQRAVAQGYRQVAAVGGDGTVHEVANGLLHSGQRDLLLAVVPLGSANDYVYSLRRALPAGAPWPRRVDVGRVRNERGQQRYFLCCLGLGLNGWVTWESRRISYLKGIPLYGLATLRALWRHYATPRMQVILDDNPSPPQPTLLLSVLLGQREGGFVLAPQARLDDGLFDYLHAGPLSRWEILRFLPRLAYWGPPAEHPQVRQGRCRRLQVHSEQPLLVHSDGEFFCTPADPVYTLTIEVLPAALQVQIGFLPETSRKRSR
jgi:diacylglycerol kinase (ATP)